MNATYAAFGGASIVLTFQGNETVPIPTLSGAADVREALEALEGVGDIEVFLTTPHGADGLAIEWRVRFYPPCTSARSRRSMRWLSPASTAGGACVASCNGCAGADGAGDVVRWLGSGRGH